MVSSTSSTSSVVTVPASVTGTSGGSTAGTDTLSVLNLSPVLVRSRFVFLFRPCVFLFKVAGE